MKSFKELFESLLDEKIEIEYTDSKKKTVKMSFKNQGDFSKWMDKNEDTVKDLKVLTEMPASIIVPGAQFTQKDLKKLKKKYPDEDDFINALNAKLALQSNDIRRLRAAFKEV